MTKPFILPGNQNGVCKPRKPKKSDNTPVPVGTAWSWWCIFCGDFNYTDYEDVTFSEAKCDHCGQKVKLNLVDPGTVTPKMPSRKPPPEKESGIREVHFEPSRGGVHGE